MPDREFDRRLAVKEDAMAAIAEIRDRLNDAVIVIVDRPPDACCQLGYHAVPLSRSELPDEGFSKIGMIEDVEVTAEIGLIPADPTKIVLGFDRRSGSLVAYVT